MAINPELFTQYDKALQLSVDGFIDELNKVIAKYEKMGTKELTEALRLYYPILINKYGDLAASIAAEYYETSRELAGFTDLYSAVLADLPREDELVSNVNYCLRNYEKHQNLERLQSAISGNATRHIMNAAEDTLFFNQNKDKVKSKWALVAHAGACAYCMMLSSRGFAYSNKDRANKSRHNSCRCTPVVDFNVLHPKLKGYSPEDNYKKWKELEANKKKDK